MAGYLILARKYRSTTFEHVVGQEPIARTLTNAIASGRIAQAYLFTGTRGVGKTTMARILAKALNCLSAEEATATPCNECDACQAIARGDDVDVIEIDGASNRGIDEIRELRANAVFRPARGRYKIYYIDEVHMLTKEAFNALLKTLEEPPSHVKFIFATTEAEKVPATILSRCQRFDFRNIPTARIAEHLADVCRSEGIDAEEDALFRVARAAAGSMRDGLSLLEQLLSAGGTVTADAVASVLGTPADERTVALARAVATGDPAAALAETAGMLEAGVGLTSLVSSLMEIFRNMMIASACGGDSALIELPEQQKADVVELAGRMTLPSIVQSVAVLETVGRSARGSSVSRALVEAGIVRLAAAEKFLDVASLTERIEALSRPGGGALKKK
jgi:DNA polymerase-3 subunit gamma/tau